MGILDSIFGPSPAQRAAREAEQKKLEEEETKKAKEARIQESWESLKRKYDSKTAITASAKSTTRRSYHGEGLVFDLDGITAYMDIREILQGYVENIEDFVGKPLTFRIISISEYNKTVETSAKVLLQEQEQKRKEEEEERRRAAQVRYQQGLEQIAKQDYVEATVEEVRDRSIKVKLKEQSDGKPVFCWISIDQLAAKHVNHPSEIVRVGDEIRADVALSPTDGRLELSMRKLEVRESEKRREELFKDLKIGDVVKGTVSNIIPSHVFVDLGGVDASVHVSQLSTERVDDPHDYYRVGDVVEAMVESLDQKNDRINLSVRKLIEAKAQARLAAHKASDEYARVDNRMLHFEGPLCLRLNDERDRVDMRLNALSESKDNLFRLFPDIANMPADDKLETLLRSTFPDGIKTQVFIRNLTFEGADGWDKKCLAIRPIITPGCYLQSVLKTGMSLIFKGRVRGKEFVVDSIYDTADTEQLDYEVACDVTPFRDPARIQQNFLFDVLKQAASITKYTSSRLGEWEAYLRWKKTVAQQQIAGCKYYDISYDASKSHLVFELVAESKDAFDAFKRYLRSRDIMAFSNNYSSDKWDFAFNEEGDRRGRRAKGVRLGKYNGILSQGYLDDLPEGYVVPLSPEDESSLRSSFDAPYMARVAYDLNDDDADDVSEQDLETEEEAEYVKSTILSNYHNQGFLALSAAGQFALISRFERAIGGLRDDASKSPNLALWLFDATRARLPQTGTSIEEDEWLNPGIARNENQRTAVQKMLDAPDLCLIQGPPGTGKTTVIAEAIYQMAKRGQRVLIASQSNDAVDNALDRLAENPQIRAIRLGQKNRRKSHMDGYVPHKYSEDEAVRSYYSSVSSALADFWLDKWDDLDAKTSEFDSDLRDAKCFKDDIVRLRQTRNEHEQMIGDLKRQLSELEAALDRAQSAREVHLQEQRQADVLRSVLAGSSIESLYLSRRQLERVVPTLSACIDKALSSGLRLVPSPMMLDSQSDMALNSEIEIATASAKSLAGILRKAEAASFSSDSSDLQILEHQMGELQAKMMAALDEGDDDAFAKLRNRRETVKLEIDRMKNSTGSVSLDTSESALLGEEITKSLTQGDKQAACETIRGFLEEWDSATASAMDAIGSLVNEATEEDPSRIIDEMKSVRGKIESKEAKSKECSDEISQKSTTLTRLSSKYSTSSETADSVIEAISHARSEHESRLESLASMRGTWERVIRGFKERLDSSEVADYDNDYFKRIYINACNVVGISCTDDMRNLDDNGFEAFDVVIIDEVSKATPPEILIPLMKARKAILVGDHRQLPQMFDEHERSYSELISDPDSIPEDVRPLMTGENFTRFQKMVTSSLFKEYFEAADDSIKHSLLVQYRMHSDIMGIINRFYDGRLEAGLSKELEDRYKSHRLTLKGIDGGSFIVPARHAYWIDSSALPDGTPVYESFPGKSTSACNYLEVETIVELIKRMATEYKALGHGKGNKKSIGVISFYQSQVNELRRRFKAAKRTFDFSSVDVDINTVDRFQGKEKNIIVVSLVRNNPLARASKHVVAFERINVAFSRAQEMLVIVGAKHMYEGLQVELPNMDTGEIRKTPVYKYILEDLHQEGCLRTTSQIIGEESAKRVIADIKKNGSKNEAR